MSTARNRILRNAFVLGIVGLVASPDAASAQAAAPPAINQADTAWMLVATALGVFLIPGNFAFVERLGRRRAAAAQPAITAPPPGHVPEEQHA